MIRHTQGNLLHGSVTITLDYAFRISHRIEDAGRTISPPSARPDRLRIEEPRDTEFLRRLTR